MVAAGNNMPLVMTPMSRMITAESTDECTLAIPGRNVVRAFINRTLDTESKEFSESGEFAWRGYINYPLPKDAGHVRVGMRVKDQYWWAPSIEGIIVDIMIKAGDSIAVVYLAGDKLATYHDLKLTVEELVPYKVTVTNAMPMKSILSITNEASGQPFRHSILISTKNVAKGLGGQTREMAATTSMFGSTNEFRTKGMSKPRAPSVLSLDDEKKTVPKLPSGEILVRDKRLTITDINGRERVIKASYGIARIM